MVAALRSAGATVHRVSRWLNAASIAGLMLTTEALVSEVKEKDEGGAGGGMPDGGMGGMDF